MADEIRKLNALSPAYKKLCAAAWKAAVNFRASPHCHVGSVGAALLAENGAIYTGTCIDLPSGIGFCAEHSAVAAMLKDKQTHITAMIAMTHDGKVIPPCGRCRELFDHIDSRNRDTEVTVAEGRIVKLAHLLPFPCRDV